MREHGRLSRGVHDDLRPDFLGRSPFALHHDTDRTLAFEEDLAYARRLPDGRSAIGRVVQQELVEIAPHADAWAERIIRLLTPMPGELP